MSTELTATQQRRRKHLEAEIRDAANKMTANLGIIDDEKLYASTHESFEAYCLDEWGMTPQHVRRLEKHKNVLGLFSEDTNSNGVHNPESEPIGSLLKESHTREVAGLPDDKKVEVLKKAVETAPTDKQGKPKVTAKHVAETRDAVIVEKPPVQTPTASIVLDGMNRAVPERLLESHSTAAEISSAASKFDAIKRLVGELAAEPGGVHIARSELETAIASLKKRLKDSRYYTECPACAGETPSTSCKRCKGAGFIPYSMKGVLNEQEKEWLGQ